MLSVEELLTSLYGQPASSGLLDQVNKLQKKYSIRDTGWRLSEKDAVLITYGDQVKGKEGSTLRALDRFLNETAQGAFSMVHILPFYPYSSDDGFSVIDYYEVNPAMGTWDDILRIANTHGIMFDAVINHNSSESEWFQQYLLGNPAYEDYYIAVDDPAQYETAVRPRTLPLFHSYETGPRHIWTTFSKDQVDLNFRNPKVLLQVLDLLLFYVSKGAQLIRLDAIGFLWKEPHTSCIHLPQTHQIIKLFRQVLAGVAPSVRLVTETNVPHEENVAYFGDGDEAHLVYNFTFPPLLAHSLLAGDVNALTTWAKSIEQPFADTCFFNFLASHDGIGLRGVQGILNQKEVDLMIRSAEANGGRVSYRSTQDHRSQPYEINCNYLNLLMGTTRNEASGIRKMILAHALLLTMPGLPAIYFHSFIGATNDVTGMEKTGQNRSINREKFSEPELIAQVDSSSRSKDISQTITHLLRLRKSHGVFHPYADFSFDQIGDTVFIIRRIHHDQQLAAYFNFSDQPVTIQLQELTFNLVENRSEKTAVQIPDLGFAWLLS